MPDNNPKNSVGGGWHLTHNIIQQIYSYSAIQEKLLMLEEIQIFYVLIII